MCCRQCACAYGEWDAKAGQCSYLITDKMGIASCGKYEEISKDPNSKYHPAFGQGCSSTIGNRDREVIIARDYGGEIPFVEIEDF